MASDSFLNGTDFAHRGLHSADGPAENSLPAFQAAIEGGYGAECDVRLSADGIPFVFHDAILDRMTHTSGALSALSAEQLDRIALRGNSGPIPRLSTLLGMMTGLHPLLIELKIDHRREIAPLCAAVAHALSGHMGAVMSFHPGVSRWFRHHAPHIPRGIVMTEEGHKGRPSGAILRPLAIWWGKPDFLAYDIRDLPSPFARACRAQSMAVLSWTVRSDADWHIVRQEADAAIFERQADEGTSHA